MVIILKLLAIKTLIQGRVTVLNVNPFSFLLSYENYKALFPYLCVPFFSFVVVKVLSFFPFSTGKSLKDMDSNKKFI